MSRPIVEQSYVIGNTKVVKTLSSDAVTLYSSAWGEDEYLFIVDSITQEVIAKVSVDPYCGEGGGGSLEVEEM